MHSATNAIRSFVSSDKRRYTAEGFNLDLTYITPRLIAMGIPGKGLSTLWRNNVEEVGKFLDSHHFQHYKIFNLGKSNNPFYKLQNFTVNFGWHAKRAPPLNLLVALVNAIEEYLNQDPQNVAVIHCKEGRERSGIAIAAFLLKSRVYGTPKEALDYYAQMRSKTREGVSTPSQIRYVNYYHSLLALGNQVPQLDKKIFIRRMVIKPIPDFHGGITPIVELINSGKVPSESLVVMKEFRSYKKLDFQIVLDMNYPLQGDVYIAFSHRANLFGLHPNIGLFRIGFHTSFVPLKWTLTKADLDNSEFAGALNDDRFRKGLQIELYFTENPFDPIPEIQMPVPQQTSIPQQQSQFPQPQQNLYPNLNQQQQYVQQPYTNESSYYPQQSTMMSSDYYPMQGMSTLPNIPSNPPPINRDSKDNRQSIYMATENVNKATEKLLQSIQNLPKQNTMKPTDDLVQSAPLPPPIQNNVISTESNSGYVPVPPPIQDVNRPVQNSNPFYSESNFGNTSFQSTQNPYLYSQSTFGTNSQSNFGNNTPIQNVPNQETKGTELHSESNFVPTYKQNV